MISVETYRALLAKVEEAKGGSEELDVKIMCALAAPEGSTAFKSPINGAWCIRKRPDNCGRQGLWEKPREWFRHEGWPLTTSIDAALALVAKVLPREWAEILREGERTLSQRYAWHICFAKPEQVSELPLAILAALLRALLQQSETAHVER